MQPYVSRPSGRHLLCDAPGPALFYVMQEQTARHKADRKIEIKEDAKNIGGINIFGEKYGDHPQGIVMNLTYL